MRKLALLLALVGCGAHDDSDPNLIGDWISQSSLECGSGASFDGSSYRLGTVCIATVGYNAQVEEGTYSTSSGRINLTAAKSSCPGTPKRSHLDYAATASTLRLSGSTGATVYERNNETGGGATVTYGCFQGRSFVAGPLAEVL